MNNISKKIVKIILIRPLIKNLENMTDIIIYFFNYYFIILLYI
jgi:hypothetical protein